MSTQALLSDDARNPTLHVQIWPPIVLVHLFPIPQMAETSLHSFTSKKENHAHFIKHTEKNKLKKVTDGFNFRELTYSFERVHLVLKFESNTCNLQFD